MKYALSLSLMFAASCSAEVPSLTPDNWDSMTAGKTVFIKFFAPWCGHCKKMAPDYEKLAAEWTDHATGFVGEVDCTADGKPLCDSNGVRGFPTLKWGDPAALDDYEGGRDYDSLSEFCKENLKPVCSPTNIDLCDDEKKAQIEKYQAMSAEEIDAAIASEEKKMDDAEETFKTEVGKLQKTYEQLMKDKDAAQAAVKASGLGLMKAVKAASKADAKEEL